LKRLVEEVGYTGRVRLEFEAFESGATETELSDDGLYWKSKVGI
jgi:hypothetical protein